MSASGNGGGSGTPGQAGTNVAIPDTIDFVYDTSTDGNITANEIVRGASDYTTVDGDPETDTNEVMEVVRAEIIPPTNSDGSLQTTKSIRLWDGDDYYDYIRLREFAMGFFGQDSYQRTPAFGNPVLAGNNPSNDPIGTATPKYGPSTEVSPAVINDGTAISDSFVIRFYVWRWKGSNSEFIDFFSDTFGQTTFQQNISFSNPYTGESQTFTRTDPAKIGRSGPNSPLGSFTKLTGGVGQSLPKVYPWFTYARNGNATEPNKEYKFTTRNGNVDEQFERLEFEYTDGERAVLFENIQVNQPDNLEEGRFVVEERDEDPDVTLTPDSRHALPILRPLDGTDRPHDAPQLPVSVPDRFGSKQAIWNDGGGFRVVDDGTSIPAGNILVAVNGWKLELTA